MIEEKNVQILLKDFVSEIEPSDNLKDAVKNLKTPAAARRPRRFSFAAAAIATAIVAVAATLFPRHVYAGSLSRLSQAISNARSLEMDLTMYYPDGAAQHRLESYYKDGMWRHNWHIAGKPTTYIERDHKLYAYWADKKFASVEEDEDEQPAPYLTGIEFARDLAEEGSISTPATRTIVPNPDIAGRATYAVIANRPTDHLHSVMVVDKATDLPLSVDVSLDMPGSTKGTRTHADYKFNTPIDDSQFEADFGVPLTDTHAARVRYLASWTKPIVTFGGANGRTAVYDAQVNRQGWVFLVNSEGGEGEPPDLGGAFVRVDLALNTTQKRVAVFVPLKGSAALPPEVSVSVSGVARAIRIGEPIGDLPDYLRDFNMGAESNLREQALWARAIRYDQLADYEDALPLFQEHYRTTLQTFRWRAWQSLEKVAECQEHLGQSGWEQTMHEAREIEKSDPHSPLNRKMMGSPPGTP